MRLLAEQIGTSNARGSGPLRLALALPAALTRRLRTQAPKPSARSLQSIPTDDLRRQLALTVLKGHPDRKVLAQHLKPTIRDWQAHDWESLGQRLGRLDMQHAALPSGDRLATALGHALFRHVVGPHVCEMMDRGQPVGHDDLDEAVFAQLIRATQADETPPTIHFLAAQFNLETGWARRGDTAAETATDDVLNAAQARFRVARGILDRIAARAPHSAYFSEFDYRIQAAEGTTEDALTRAAIRWSRTDPTSLSVHAVHGLHLLPSWYGTEGSLSRYADRTWSKTHDALGAAAYAACHLSAMEADASVLLTMDMHAFRDGLIDMMQESDDPDVTCNAVLRTLWEVSTESFAAETRDTTALRRARRELRAVFTYLTRHTLGPVIPGAWGAHWTEARILHALAEAFADEITSGRCVTIGMDGARIDQAA